MPHLFTIITGILRRFVKQESVPLTFKTTADFDVFCSVNYMPVSQIDAGFIAKGILINVKKKKDMDRKILEFYNECKEFFIKLISKL